VFTTDGFYRTGDLARITPLGLSIEGRIKDLINRGGEKINAEEVEALLLRHPAIALAAVVAMPDPRLGERACAFVVPRGEPPTFAEIQAHLRELGVAKFKWPERLEWRSDLPRSNVNKLDKQALRAEIRALLSAEESAPSRQ
jgi:2,3-dihydroxybenzoate-AMP ligase